MTVAGLEAKKYDKKKKDEDYDELEDDDKMEYIFDH